VCDGPLLLQRSIRLLQLRAQDLGLNLSGPQRSLVTGERRTRRATSPRWSNEFRSRSYWMCRANSLAC
jgi:hypothetical protein